MTVEAASLQALFGADTSGLARGIQDADRQLQRAQRSIGQRMDAIGGTVKNVGVRMTAIGGAATAAFGLTVKAAMDWESAFAGVVKTVDGTEDELRILEGTIRRMARDSENPLSGLDDAAVTLAGIAEMAGQLGVKVDDIAGFTQVIGELTLATDLTADSASMMIAQFANIMGMDLGGSELRSFADKLVAVGNNAATTESAVMGMAQRIAGVNVTWGIDPQETLAVAGALSSLGINAEAGGTAWATLVRTMGTAAATHNEDLAGFARVAGETQDAFAETWNTEPMDAIIAFLEGFAQLSPAEQAEALEQLGLNGERVAAMILGLAPASDVMVDLLALEGADAANREASARLDTFEARLNTTKNKINDWKIDLGNILLPALTAVLEGLDPVIERLQGYTNEHPDVVSATAAIALGLLGLGLVAIPVGAAISALGGIIGTVAGILTGVGGMMGAAGGTGAIAAVGALTLGVVGLGIAAGVALYKWDWFRQNIAEPIVLDSIEGLRAKILLVKGAIDVVGQAWQGLVWMITGSTPQVNQDLMNAAVVATVPTQASMPNFMEAISGGQSAISPAMSPAQVQVGGALYSQYGPANLSSGGLGAPNIGGNVSPAGGGYSPVPTATNYSPIGKALGGPMTEGGMVGERGPEWFEPWGSGGRVIPNDMLDSYRGGGSGRVINLYNPVFQGVEDPERFYDLMMEVEGRRA